MKATWVPTRHPHVLLEDIFTPEEVPQVMKELHRMDKVLLPPHLTGTATKEGRPLKYNDATSLANLNWKSSLYNLCGNHLFEELTQQIPALWFRNSLTLCNRHSYMVSRYRNGQYYNSHFDRSFFSILIWMYDEPKSFTGGDLIFTDYSEVIECKNNTGVLFLGPIRHEVPPIEGEGRYTITRFSFNQ